MMEMSWSQVSARRLERHGLTAPAKDATPADVVAAMCGAHAQVMSAAELSVGLRLDGVTRTGVREALWGERSLVKTHGPRGTVHLLPARDLPMWIGALSSLPSSYAAHAPGIRLTPAQTDQVVEAIREVLTGATLTIDELSDAVVAVTGSWAGDLVMPAFQTMWPRWRQAMATAAHRGAFVFGPARGRKVTYTAPPAGFRPAEGCGELVDAYLRAYGPATPEQFAKWIGAPVKWAAAAFAAAELEQVLFDGIPAWVAAGDTEVPDEPPRGVRLLPYFDAYVVAGRPRELLYPGAAAARALAGGQAGNFPVLLVDGQVAGVWHQRRSGRRLAVTVETLRELTPAQLRELDEQVALAGQILEGEPRLTLGPITVGGHA
ncbi:winged helix DNA-binding domain-containing protein [Nonomuraea sp. NEAU-A123]|uniref:winged helix DNA-binding domain-containing protein n=1 Tax=Nonomuraea sp. NEAU-A123 TaxID=2839649 RepID=UPI001BE484D1|nr:winged helix DNA-binding domain-containing protein [Nonomuraea sp. NEAU-A123]MBT2227594.1 winged helix DNA-binding domain-containing protein [Nonomuraea sp. NEAU-A123]